MKRSFQIPLFVGCSFVEGKSSRHVGLDPPLAVQRENISIKIASSVRKFTIIFIFFIILPLFV